MNELLGVFLPLPKTERIYTRDLCEKYHVTLDEIYTLCFVYHVDVYGLFSTYLDRKEASVIINHLVKEEKTCGND